MVLEKRVDILVCIKGSTHNLLTYTVKNKAKRSPTVKVVLVVSTIMVVVISILATYALSCRLYRSYVREVAPHWFAAVVT